MSTQTGSISFEATGGFNSYAKQNYATLSQIKGQFATCGTGAATAAKVATIVPADSGWTLYEGATVTVKFTSKNTAATPTLNVNNTGAKEIRNYNGDELSKEAREWLEGSAMALTYDGTYWRIQDSNLMERMYSAETAIEQNANAISLSATKEEVENIQIGGRNLFRNTSTLSYEGNNNTAMILQDTTGWFRWNSGATIERTSDGLKCSLAGNSSSGFVIPLVRENILIPDQKYTISFNYRGTITDTGGIHLLCRSGGNVSLGSFMSFSVSETEWKYYKYTFTCADYGTKTLYALLIPYTIQDGKWLEIKDASAQLELGNKATDWTPAPEDIEAYTDKQISTTKSEIKVTTDGISSEVSKMTSIRYLETGYQYALSNIKTYSTEGYSGTWSTKDRKNAKVGDTVYLQVKDTTRSCYVYIKATVTALSGTNGVTCTSHGYEDTIPVDTIKSTINQSSDSVKIQAKHVDIEGAAIFSSGGAYDKSTTAVKTETQWYSSTSATSKSGGSWGTTQPIVTAGRYIWQRELVTYANGNTAYKPSEAGVCTQGQTDLSSYSTTTQMNSAIGSAKSEIIYDVDDGYGVLMPFSRRMNLGSANQSTGTWRLAGSSQMTRTRELISDGPYGACYCFQNSGIQTNTDDSSCYGIDSFNFGSEWNSSKIYIASMYARVTSGSGMAGFAFYGANYLDGSHNTVWGSYKMTTLTSNWIKVWITFTRTSDPANIYIGAAGTNTTTAATVQMCMFRIEEFSGNYSDIQNLSNALGGFDILWNRAEFSNDNNAGGECYLCALDPLTNQRSDANGWTMWNGVKRTITKGIYNINTVAPYNIPIYIVYRLSNATSTTGSGYFVWYNSGWKSTPQSAGMVSAWTWAEATDMVLGKFVEPGSEVAFTECETYNPPRKWGAITTDTTTAHSAQNTANNAAPKTSAVSRTQRIYYQSASTTKPATPGTASSNWVSDESGAADKWTLKRMSYSSTKPYIYTCEQKQVVSGTVSYTPVLLDDTTTVIDGGKIITGSIDANAINANTISGSSLTISSFKDSDDYLNSNIQVGGRNLLLQSQIFGTTEKQKRIVGKYINNELLVEREDGFNEVQANANFRGISVYVNSMGFVVGDKLIFSTNVRSDSTVGTTLTFYCMAFNSSGTRVQTALLHLKTRATQGDGASANIYANNSFQAGAEERIIIEITWLQAAQDLLDAGGNICFTIQATSSDWSKGNVAMWAPKLEKGNVATDWTPAPEDIDSAVDDASKIASNYIHADSTGINIYDNSLTNASKYYLRQTAGGTYIYRNSYLKAKYEDTITLYGGSNASGANPRTEFSSTALKFIDANGKNRFWIDGTAADIYDTDGKLGTRVDANGLTMYQKNSKRAATTANGLDIFGSDGSTSIASFGATARIGTTSTGRVEVTATGVGLYNKNNKMKVSIGTGSSVFYGGEGTYPYVELGTASTSAINIKQSATSYTSITSSGLDVYTTVSSKANKAAHFGTDILLYNSSGKYMLWANGNGISLYDQSQAERIAINSGGITIKGGTTNQERLVISSGAATFFDGGNKARLKLNGTDGVVIGNTTDANKGRMQIKDDKILFYDNSGESSLGAMIDANGLTIYQKNSKRAATTANGLDIFGSDGSTKIASFGTTATIGATNNAHFIMAANKLQAFSSTNTTTPYFEVSASAMKYGSYTVANTGDVANAGNTASLFITPINDNEIKLHSKTGKASNNYAKMNSDGLWVYKQNNLVAKFSDSITLGKETRTRVEVDFNSFRMLDRNGNKYCHISDLRDESGSIYLEEKFVVPDSGRVWPTFEYNKNYVTIYFNQTAYTYNSGIIIYESSTNTIGGSANRPIIILNTTTIPVGSTITVKYLAIDDRLKGYTFGIRNETDSDKIGGLSFSEGYHTSAIGHYSHSEGEDTTASGRSSHAEGASTTASGLQSHTEGWRSVASGEGSHAEGGSHTGEWSIASGVFSHAEGTSKAAGRWSHAENGSTANGDWSHAEGTGTANGRWSHAEGNGKATGSYSHAEGSGTASGYYSHASGAGTIAGYDDQFVCGKYNSNQSTSLFEIGNGTNSKSANALTVDKSGNLTASGTITANKDLAFGNGTTATLIAKTPSRTAGVLWVGGSKKAAGDANGTVVRLQGGGLMLVGGGEYPTNRYNLANLNDGDETLFLGSDGAVYVETNGQTIANRKTFTFGADGTFNSPSTIKQNGTAVSLSGTSLYENTSGKFAGEIPLSETAANFTFIEIYCKDNDGRYCYTKVWNPNGKTVNVTQTLSYSGDFYIKSKAYAISGTGMDTAHTGSTYHTGEVNAAWSNSGSSSDILGVVKVIGYK